MKDPERYSYFPNGVRPSSGGRWVKYTDYKHLAELVERFASLYGEVALTGAMIATGRELWRDYYKLSGEHVILTDEGWESGEVKQSYLDEIGPEAIQDELNAPQ